MIQRIKTNIDQKFTDFSPTTVLMIKFYLSFCIFLFIYSLIGISSAFADNSLFIDSIPPAPTLNAGSLTVGGSFTVGIGFSEEVFGLTADDFLVENGTVIEVTGEEMNFTVLIDPLAVGVVSFKVPAGVVQDQAGNDNLASGTLKVTFIDEESPSVTLSTPQNTIDSVFPVTVTFSEPVSGLEISDFNVSNGAAISLSGNETAYTLLVNPGAIGAVSLFLPAASVVDTVGNENLVSNFLQVNFGTIDITPPEVVLTTASTEVSEAFIIEIRSSEAILGLEISDFTVNNAVLSNLSGVENVFTVLATPVEEGEISIKLEAETISDLFNNLNGASNELVLNYLVPLAPDTIRPAIFLEQLVTEIEGSYKIRIGFSETVTELFSEDLNFNNAVVSSFEATDSKYTIEITALDFGIVEFSIGENVVFDESGNGNLSTGTLVWDFADHTTVNPDPVFDISLNRIEDRISIDWVTNTEANNEFFEVWHSDDGINFSKLEDLNSTNNEAGLFPYNYVHSNPVFGINHYYVRQYDQSEDYVDSKIAIIDFMNLNPETLIYPNPASDNVTFNTTPYAGQRCEIMVYNSLGQIFMLDTYEELPSSPLEIDLRDFQEGVYGVQFWIKETARIEASFLVLR